MLAKEKVSKIFARGKRKTAHARHAHHAYAHFPPQTRVVVIILTNLYAEKLFFTLNWGVNAKFCSLTYEKF